MLWTFLGLVILIFLNICLLEITDQTMVDWPDIFRMNKQKKSWLRLHYDIIAFRWQWKLSVTLKI